MRATTGKAIKVTRNQYRVFLWLRGIASGAGIFRCSARKLSLEFSWSDQYASQLLGRMEEKGLIELLEKGRGQRATKYKLLRIKLSCLQVKPPKENPIPELPEDEINVASKSQRVGSKKTGKSLNVRRQVATFTAPTVLPVRRDTDLLRKSEGLTRKSNKANSNKLTKKTQARIAPAPVSLFTQAARIREEKVRKESPSSVVTIFSRRPPVVTPPKAMNSPFRRFDKKKYSPETWNAQDIVCYYALMFKSYYGNLPAINWRVEVAAARNLLNAFSQNPDDVKHYLKLAFENSKIDFAPHGLQVFTQAWVINKCLTIWDKGVNMPELDDTVVLAQ